MSTQLAPAPRQRYELFEATCAAAGVQQGAPRIGVFLQLPKAMQITILEELNATPSNGKSPGTHPSSPKTADATGYDQD